MTAVLPSLRPLTASEQTLVDANLGLIGHVIQRRCRSFLTVAYDRDDAWQDGYIGLCRAAKTFDPTVAKISTYACHWIYMAIQRGAGIVGGKSFRAGYGEDAPASLDQPALGTEGLTHLDFVAGSEPCPSAAVESAHVAAVILAGCRDDADRAAAAWLLGDEQLQDIAQRFAVPIRTIRDRAKRLRALAAQEMAS